MDSQNNNFARPRNGEWTVIIARARSLAHSLAASQRTIGIRYRWISGLQICAREREGGGERDSRGRADIGRAMQCESPNENNTRMPMLMRPLCKLKYAHRAEGGSRTGRHRSSHTIAAALYFHEARVYVCQVGRRHKEPSGKEHLDLYILFPFAFLSF